jgi:hypothetical protein
VEDVAVNTHELARLLLSLPDLPVATHARNETYGSAMDASSCGPLKIGLLKTYVGDHIVIGDISRMNLNAPNWFVSEMLHGDAPWEWWRRREALDAGDAKYHQAEIARRVAENAEHLARVADFQRRRARGEDVHWTIKG